MLSLDRRLHGLMTALTVKHAQDDLVIVDDLEGTPDDEVVRAA